MTTLKKILYAEDQMDIQLIASVALEKIGHYEVVVCSNGSEVVQTVATFNPDLLLLDVMMPALDGPQALAAVRKIDEFKHIPAIFITAKVLTKEIDELMSLGALGVIIKPFDPATLSSEIQRLWDERI